MRDQLVYAREECVPNWLISPRRNCQIWHTILTSYFSRMTMTVKSDSDSFVLPSQVGFASATGDHSRVVRSHLQAGEPARAIAVLREQKKPGA